MTPAWLASAALAVAPLDVEPTAMGYTAAADLAANGSIVANPGLLGLIERYDVVVGAGFGPAGAWSWTASATDARTSERLSLGIAYTGLAANPAYTTATLPGWSEAGLDPSNRQRDHDLAGGLSLALADRRVAVGLGGDLLFYDHDRYGRGVTGDLDAGIGVRIVDGIVAGVSAVDLLEIDPVALHERALQAGLRCEDAGVGALAATLRAPLDGGPLRVGAGGELILGAAALRTGWRYDDADPAAAHALTFGIGAHSEAGSIGYALVVPLAPGDEIVAGLVNAVSIRIAAPDSATWE